MGFDTHDRREPCLFYTQPGPLTRPSPTRQACTLPRPCLATALSGGSVAVANPGTDGGTPIPADAKLTANGGKPTPLGGKPMPAATGRHCVVILDKLRPGQTSSRVLSQTCADRADAPALNMAAATSTLLLVLYEHVDYGGASTKIYGSYGPCDREGYGVSALVSSWRNRISSLKGFNYCNVIELYDGINYATFLGSRGTVGSRLDWNWVGSYANDKTDSIITFRQE